jgi:hypothetical protein
MMMDDDDELLIARKGKVIPVTNRRGPLRCETPRLPHFLDDRLRDGLKPQEDSWYSFLLAAEP